jgi:hypothetical protein
MFFQRRGAENAEEDAEKGKNKFEVFSALISAISALLR